MTDLMWDMAHPVGSVMQVTNGFDPNDVRGTWEKVEGRFLLASGGGYERGSTGGEANHKLSEEEMPKHWHALSIDIQHADKEVSGFGIRSGESFVGRTIVNGIIGKAYADYTGGSKSHNNMPPYLAVDTWRRVA